MQRAFVASLGLVVVACGGPSAPNAAPAPPSSAAIVLPITHPPPRSRDDESDAWEPGGQRGSAPQKPEVECPSGSRFTGSTCVYTEVTCPSGSKRVHNTCIGDVTCPSGGVWDGDTCRPVAPSVAGASSTPPTSLAAPSPYACFFNINSIPASQALIDGYPVGWTPRIRAAVSPGTHTVTFVTDRAKKTVSATCATGETKVVVVKFQMDDPGY